MISLPPKLLRRGLLAALIVVAVGSYFLSSRREPPKYITAQVTRGPIVRMVIASGTVNPVVTVQVGSYVSGPIQAIYADYNSPVKQGQLIAKIDPRPFEVKAAQARAALANARAVLSKSQADLVYRKLAYERNAVLLKQGAVSHDLADATENAYRQALAQVDLAKAQVQQQQAALEEAEVNLNYTNIVSPVDGTVVSRNVDVGQTVAASFQTPTLFLIARDLAQMQVDASVSESDIGNLRVGQFAGFTVDAFPNRQFQGAVAQVRQAPIAVQNVVTYDVVVGVANPELLLKPGMTANLTIVTASRKDVLRVPVQALRFKPSGWQAPSTRDQADDRAWEISRRARIWLLDGGRPKPVAITTGLDDGTNVEVIAGAIEPGEQVVTDELRARKSSAGALPRFMP